MARKLRAQYPGTIYHVINRGDRREAIFVDDQDRELFLETLKARVGSAGLGGPPQGRHSQGEDCRTLAWIAARLHMRTPGHLSCLLWRKDSNQVEPSDGRSVF